MAVNGRRRLMINMNWNLDMVATMKSEEWDPMMEDKIGPMGPGFKDIIPQPSEQKLAQYIEKHKDSEGFDVDEFRSFIGFAYHVDLKEQPGLLKDANTLSQMAINMYNKYHGTSYRFIKVLQLYVEPVAGFVHYITFAALDENKVPHVGETFQARGSRLMPNETRPDGLTVEDCRVKGT